MNVRVSRKFRISCAHFLPGHPKCGTIHGHNYTIELIVGGARDHGMVIDFALLKKLFQEHIGERYDHRFLNDFAELGLISGTIMPTAEIMALVIADRMEDALIRHHETARLFAVRVWETEDCYAEVQVE